MKKRRSLHSLINSLVDDEGLKTEVTITLTNQTLFKIVAALLVTGMGVTLVSQLLKNRFPNQQLTTISKQINTIKNQLQP